MTISKANPIKQKHEMAACKRFLSSYNIKTGKELKLIRLGNPNRKEPDCVCNNNVAIELVNKFDNSYQAERMWNEARGIKKKVSPQNILLQSTQQDFDRVIADKLRKLDRGNYNGFSGKIILVNNLQSPLIGDCDIDSYFRNYKSFKQDSLFNKYFDEIWVTWKSDTSGEWKIRQLE